MQELAAVSVFHGRAGLHEQLEPLAQVKTAVIAVSCDRFTLDEVHHQVGNSLFGCTPVDQACDAGMT